MDEQQKSNEVVVRRRVLIGILVAAVLAVGIWAVWSGRPGAAPASPSPSSAQVPDAGGQTSTPAASSDAVPPANDPAGRPAVDPVAPSASPVAGVLPEMPAVGLDSDSELPGRLTVSLEKIEKVQGEARLPGEVAGEALRLTVLIHNEGSESAALDAVVVNGYYGEALTPLETLTAPGGSPFSGSLAPDGESRGVYLFRLYPEASSDVTVAVDTGQGRPAAVFRGDAR
ncbi:MAG: hypothetical protein QM708_11355 [Propioniciclava sp.]|uniref:hypothetical protein n=1 Tax=Propioniciclava sp. TaxID=2038686 RepID=UPI0039E66EAE